jgi:hypothetical protein
MKNPLSPTLDCVREWAFEAHADEPSQAWDLVLVWQTEESHMRLFIELASDSNCPKWRYFLDLLYLVIEYAVRHGHLPDQHARYTRLIGLSRGSKDEYVKLWRNRAQLLIDSPEEYNAEQWFANRCPYDVAP